MIFAGKEFFVFLPVVLLVYHLLRWRTARYGWLTLASWVFYAWASPGYLWVILLLTGIDWWAGRRIASSDDNRIRKRWLLLSIVSNLGLLAAFKYAGFVVDNGLTLAKLCGVAVADRTWDILLPLGISFHTFQGISYTADVYRRQIPAVRSLLDYALFVAFFPQMAAGPIVRAVEFLPQMLVPPVPTVEQITDGFELVARGLVKKLLIADHLDSLFVSAVFDTPEAYSAAACRWAVVAWAVQIYCDFSGYSDVAVGVAKWFGFDLPANFDLPFLATSITDFWRRWHLSLSTWLRDYLYFPLGGSKRGEVRTAVNLMLVFVLCGLWHGATWAWLAYGTLNGLLMVSHRMLDRRLTGVPWADRVRQSRPWAAVGWIVTMTQLLVGLVLIRMPDWATGWELMSGAVVGGGIGGVPGLVPGLVAVGLAEHVLAVVRGRGRLPARALFVVLALAAVLVFGPGVGKTFIYIQF